MYGKAIGTLNVWGLENGVYTSQPLWSLSGNQGKRWSRASFPFYSNQPFQVNLNKCYVCLSFY